MFDFVVKVGFMKLYFVQNFAYQNPFNVAAANAKNTQTATKEEENSCLSEKTIDGTRIINSLNLRSHS